MVTSTTTTMLMKMFVLTMMLMMTVMSVSKAFPDKTSLIDLLEDSQTIDVRANYEDSTILCKDDQLDIAFIIDTSRSIHAHEYDQQIKFILKLVSIFNISPENIRVAAISFGQEVVRDTAFGFSTYKTKKKVLAGIKGIVYRGRDMGDKTETGIAIAFARKNVFSNTREGVKRICIVLTDGRSTDPLQTKQEASYARKDGIKMIAVGIGNNVSMEELKAIASNRELVFKIDSYDLLPQFERHVMTKTCENLYNVVNDTEIIITDETPISMKFTTTPYTDLEGPISMKFTTKPPIDTGEEGPISMKFTTKPPIDTGEEGPISMKFTTRPPIDTGEEGPISMEHTTTLTPSVDVTRPISDKHPCQDQLLDVNVLFRPSRIPPRYVMKLIDKSISADAMDEDIVRVGVIPIPKTSFKGFRLNHYRSKGEIKEHFETHNPSFILTPSLLDLRAKGFHKLNGGRAGARKIGILLIDEKVTDIETAIEEAKFVEADGIEMYVISLGGHNADDAIVGLVDNKRSHIVHASLFSDLPYIADLLVRKICVW